MRLEARDLKTPRLICVATVGTVTVIFLGFLTTLLKYIHDLLCTSMRQPLRRSMPKKSVSFLIVCESWYI